MTGQFEKSLESCDKADSAQRRAIQIAIARKLHDYFGLKQYDQAIEWARRAIAIDPSYPGAHGDLIAALALTGHEAEAREALQRFLALPPSGMGAFRTIAAWKAYRGAHVGPHIRSGRSRFSKPENRGTAQGGAAGGMKQV